MTAERISIEIPASARYLHLLSSCIANLVDEEQMAAEPSEAAYRIQLAAQEIGSNIVQHAYKGRGGDGRILVHMILEGSPRRLVIELRDSGNPFDPAKIPPPDLDEARVRGYGLYLARALLDELRYEALPGENRWHLVKNLEG